MTSGSRETGSGYGQGAQTDSSNQPSMVSKIASAVGLGGQSGSNQQSGHNTGSSDYNQAGNVSSTPHAEPAFCLWHSWHAVYGVLVWEGLLNSVAIHVAGKQLSVYKQCVFRQHAVLPCLLPAVHSFVHTLGSEHSQHNCGAMRTQCSTQMPLTAVTERDSDRCCSSFCKLL